MQTDSQTKSFQVGSATFGDGRLTIIAGPCVIESEEHAMMMARECAQRARDAGLDFVFKTSFDKANRSSIKSFRGIGLDAGLEILQHIVAGKSNKEIAVDLGLSSNTVAVHRANIMDALGIHKTAELVVYAIRNGLVNLP